MHCTIELTCPNCGATNTVEIQADYFAGSVTCRCGTTWPLISHESETEALAARIRELVDDSEQAEALIEQLKKWKEQH